MPNPRLKPEIVGGHYLSSMRAQFDQDSKNIIVASNRQLFYYNIETRNQAGRAYLNSSTLSPDERIVVCDKLDGSMYVMTNYGSIFLWSLETRDWINELALPLNENETLISCKMLSKRQYVYSILDNETKKTTLYFSMSRSERERPKQREAIGECTLGEQHTFDIGAFVDLTDLEGETRANRDKQAKQRCLTYIHGSHVYFQRFAINEKYSHESYKQRIKDLDFTCVRANAKRPLVAAGDSLGRIYLYSGNFGENKFNRTKLHWHTLPVNDLCFSSTGNTLFSVGGESGCVVVWDLSENNIGQKRIVPRLGMPIRFVNCSSTLNQLVLSFEDNEIQFMDTNNKTSQLNTLTRRTIDMYKANDNKALRYNRSDIQKDKSIGLLWHSITDSLVTNARTGWLQLYSPKEKSRIQALNFLKTNLLSLEKEARVIPSDITRATLTLDGNWLAFYETRESENSFPDVKLHIWQRSSATNRWVWIQTADRLHASATIADLKFSPDGQFLVSVSDDGSFQVLHRVSFESNFGRASKPSKEMYAKGFIGNAPEKLPAMATFSQDSSVMAMSLKNDTTLIWMIVDPFKLVYECQLCQIDSKLDQPNGTDQEDFNSKPFHQVLGLHFGYHKPSQSVAPLCAVRSNSIRIWNILNSEETMEYPSNDHPQDDENCGGTVEFTAAAFDQCPGDGRSLNHFAVCTKDNHVMIFKLQIDPTTRTLLPLIVVDCSLPYANPDSPLYYSHMCFLGNPILDIDQQCHQDPQLVKLLNRLCLMNNYQELVSITDMLTLERQSACNNCNENKTFDLSELQEYFSKTATTYREETKELVDPDKSLGSNTITEKQRKIRKRLEVQKMLKDVLTRIPSQNLPNMNTLGPMILDKLI